LPRVIHSGFLTQGLADIGLSATKPKKPTPPVAALPPSKGGAMKVRVVHENKAADLVVMGGETVGGLRNTLHGIFKINLDRLQMWKDDKMLSDSAGTLISQGVGEGSVVNVTISAPVIVKKNVPATPEEALQREEEEVERNKILLDNFVNVVTEQWQATPPSDEDMRKMEWECKGADEMLTQCLLRLDNIETGPALRDRRRACLRKIEALQDGGVICVRESVNAFRAMAAEAAAAAE